MVGHRKNVGVQLLDIAEAVDIENAFRTRLVLREPAHLARECNPASLAAFMAETEDGRLAVIAAAEDDEFMLGLLRSATRGRRCAATPSGRLRFTRTRCLSGGLWRRYWMNRSSFAACLSFGKHSLAAHIRTGHRMRAVLLLPSATPPAGVRVIRSVNSSGWIELPLVRRTMRRWIQRPRTRPKQMIESR